MPDIGPYAALLILNKIGNLPLVSLFIGNPFPSIQARVLYVHEGVGIGVGFIHLKPEDHVKILKIVEG